MTIYVDYNATTPLCAPARDAMLPYLERHYGNPSSIHAAGREARAAIDDARDRLSAIIGAKPHELIFTATGTEANNLAILGLARAHAARGRHLICAGTEHHAVLHAFQHLQRDEAFDVTFLGVDEAGLIDPEQLAAMIRPDTTLISIMTANNETGVVQPMRAISGICRTRGVLLHSDMVQSFSKLPINFFQGVADAASFAAHKFYGPKGAGFLYLRAGVSIQPILFGGAHENDRRPGTENVPAIAGMAAAAEWAHADLDAEQPREAALRDQLWRAIAVACPTARQNGDVDQRLANTLNVSFPGVSSETMLMALDLEGVCASSGSACMVGSVMASHVLLAMGHAAESAASAVRFSLGRQTTPEEIAAAADAIQRILARISPTPEQSERRPYAAV